MSFAGGLSFDILKMIDNTGIRDALTAVNDALIKTNGANSDVWEQQREVIYKQYSLRLDEVRSGAVDDVFYANLKQAIVGDMYHAADAAGVPATPEAQKAAYAEFEANVTPARQGRGSGRGPASRRVRCRRRSCACAATG